VSPRPFDEPEPTGEPRADALRRLIAIVDRLRDPADGCPWDLAQTLESIAPHHLEEAHELVEAIEEKDNRHTLEEAGDLLMGIVLLARDAEQAGRFGLADVVQGVCEKLIRRHPHVFGDTAVDSPRAALANWERIKQDERRDQQADSSALAGVPIALPALQRAKRMGDKAIAHGFRWADVAGAFAKLGEELGELADELEQSGVLSAREGRLDQPGARGAAEVERELGDVLLAGALLGSYLGIDPERATRAAVRRFERRFRAMEAELGEPLEGRALEELMGAWERAKRAEEGSSNQERPNGGQP
jgi:MazG family protein